MTAAPADWPSAASPTGSAPPARCEDETEGAFAGLSMGLTALATSIMLPILLVVLT